jgi:outer membrane biosynthesis protein TonB
LTLQWGRSISLLITILTVVCLAASCAKAQVFPIVQEIPTKPRPQIETTELTEAQNFAINKAMKNFNIIISIIILEDNG